MKLGILGGGQLGCMIAQSAHKFNIETYILSFSKDDPANLIYKNNLILDNFDPNSDKQIQLIINFANNIDICVIETENIDLEIVKIISNIVKLYPNIDILKICQNRIFEKEFLRNNNIKIANYYIINDIDDLNKYANLFNYKAIVKTAKFGYDGHGQYNISSKSDIDHILDNKLLDNEILKKSQFIIEEKISFNKELSIIAFQNKDKYILYDIVENIHKESILRKTIYPADIDISTRLEINNIAIKIIQKLQLNSIIAIEFFLDNNNQILVNELAPRPHNSGHFTMDSCLNSQFDQLIRLIQDYPFGNYKYNFSGYMENIIGEDIYSLDSKMRKNSKIYLYNKREVRKKRKMGHINFLQDKII